MKKIVTFVSAGAIMLASCGGKKEEGGASAATKKNLEVNAAIAKCFETKDFSKIGDYLATDFVDYAGETGPVKGIEENKKAFEKMSSSIDMTTSKIKKAFGDDEYVMSWMEMAGTLKTDAMGMKAGQKLEMNPIELTQFKDGKAIAHWTYMEIGEMMKMMGSMPPPGQKPAEMPKDSIGTPKM